MKKALIAVAIVATLVTGAFLVPSFAGRGHHGMHDRWHHTHGFGGFGHRFEGIVERMADRLDLSQEQRLQMLAIVDETRPVMRELRSSFREQRRAFMELKPTDADYQVRLTELAEEAGKLANRAVVAFGEARGKVAALLTPEQRQQLDEWRQSRWGHK